jgi:hypothetical protein
MAAAQIVMNLKARLTNYVAKCEDITVVRIGIHDLSFLFVPFAALFSS